MHALRIQANILYAISNAWGARGPSKQVNLDEVNRGNDKFVTSFMALRSDSREGTRHGPSFV